MGHHWGVTDAPALGEGVQPTGRKNARLRQTVKDMVWSMLVVLGVVAVVMLFAWRPEPEAVKVIDPQQYVAAAAESGDLGVLVPSGLSEGWRPTSARWEQTPASGDERVLRIGYVTPSGEYAQISQFAFDPGQDPVRSDLVREQAQGIFPDSTRTVDGAKWLAAEFDGERMLAAQSGTGVVVVSGTAGWGELDQLAQSLQPAG